MGAMPTRCWTWMLPIFIGWKRRESDMVDGKVKTEVGSTVCVVPVMISVVGAECLSNSNEIFLLSHRGSFIPLILMTNSITQILLIS